MGTNGAYKSDPKRLAMRIFFGAVAGTATGILVGEQAIVLEPLGNIYVSLLVMCVFPYLVTSLLHGLGKLTPEVSRRIFTKGWPAFAIGWLIVIVSMMLLTLIFPSPDKPPLINAAAPAVARDFVSLFVPTNFILDLSRNYVPAVVIFAIIYGIAMQQATRKSAFLEITEGWKNATVVIWNRVVLFAPFGVFALFATTAGVMTLRQISGLMLYVTVSLAGSFMLAFLILPLVLSALTDISYREFMREMKGAYFLSLATTLSVVALPAISAATEKFITSRRSPGKDLAEVVGTNVSLAYPFAQLGNLKVALFFAFCSFYYQVPYNFTEQIMLPLLSLLATIGSPSGTVVAVDFIAGVFGLPPAAKDVYVAASTFTRYGQVALSVTGFSFATILATFSFYGMLRIRPARLGAVLVVTAALILVPILASRKLPLYALAPPHVDFSKLRIESSLAAPVRVIQGGSVPDSRRDSAESTFQRIRSSGVLRVGYNDEIIPFCYRNSSNELVGHDVACMYRLARDLNVALEFIRFDPPTLLDDLRKHRFDIAIGGNYVTTERLEQALATKPYYQSPPTLIARSNIAEKLTSREGIAGVTDLKVACSNSPVLQKLTAELLPGRHVVTLASHAELTRKPELDCILWTLVQAKAFARTYPGFTAVVPKDLGGLLMMAFLVPQDGQSFQRYLDYWLDIKKSDGFMKAQEEYWLNGVEEQGRTRRWSVIKDVL